MRTRTLGLLLACLALPPAAAAQDYPKLRPGLWELKRTSGGADVRPMQMCIDETTQRQMWDMGIGTMKGMCSKHEFRISGDRGAGDFVCDLGTSTMRSKAVIKLTGDTAYRTEIDTTFDPPMNGQAKSHSVIEARYTGACKTGQRPGDVTLENGQTINLRDALGGARKK